MTAIKVNDLKKSFKTKIKKEGFNGSIEALLHPQYKEFDAVNGICFEVEKGEILAFIGPNGAGKSTTIKMLTGILHPTSGQIDVLGLNPQHDRKKLAYKIGSVFGQKSQLWFHLPPLDSFKLFGAIYEIPDSDLKKRISNLIELFEIQDLMETPVRKLSLGQRIICEIAVSLLHKPEIIFLDEPTIGLDVVLKQKIRDLIIRLNKEENTTIFLTSHDAGDIEQLCDRAIIINHGSVVLNDSIKNLKYNYLNKKIIGVRYSEEVNIDFPGVEIIKHKGYAIKIGVDTKTQNLQNVVQNLMNAGNVLDITIEDRPMEDIIALIYTSPKLTL